WHSGRSGVPVPEVQAASRRTTEVDGEIASTPVYCRRVFEDPLPSEQEDQQSRTGRRAPKNPPIPPPFYRGAAEILKITPLRGRRPERRRPASRRGPWSSSATPS